MMGGGRNRGEILLSPPAPGSTPGLPHAKRTPPSPSHDSQLLLGAVYCAQYMYLVDYVITSITERACAHRNARLLNFVRYGRVRVTDKHTCISSIPVPMQYGPLIIYFCLGIPTLTENSFNRLSLYCK